MEVRAGQIYRHYKGNYYEVISVALPSDESNPVAIVTYQQLWLRYPKTWWHYLSEFKKVLPPAEGSGSNAPSIYRFSFVCERAEQLPADLIINTFGKDTKNFDVPFHYKYMAMSSIAAICDGLSPELQFRLLHLIEQDATPDATREPMAPRNTEYLAEYLARCLQAHREKMTQATDNPKQQVAVGNSKLMAEDYSLFIENDPSLFIIAES